MEVAKASKKQAADESRAHVENFESMVATQQAGLGAVLEMEIGKMYNHSGR